MNIEKAFSIAPLFGVRMVWHAPVPKITLYAVSEGTFSQVPRNKAARFSRPKAMEVARSAEAYESGIRAATGRQTRIEVCIMPSGKLVKRLPPNAKGQP